MGKPQWWKSQRFPPLGNGTSDASLPVQALVQHAIEAGIGPVYDNSLNGVFRGVSFEEVVGKFMSLDMRAVFASHMQMGDTFQKYILVREDTCVVLCFNDGNLEARIATTDKALFDEGQKILETYIGPEGSTARKHRCGVCAEVTGQVEDSLQDR
jgi:hypothetical protein